ncbi:hypothetical protein CHR60_10325 [Faecalibacterium prausnitzii]|uniref:Uncharacterized protein n=1 Tax=Faecalibacterium prausnitzii TaxID=853 RepID=A0A2A7B4F2_9FIRM|nr:hypothetical protein CHR60_10325 [Faecalibacterium prausnitzii]
MAFCTNFKQDFCALFPVLTEKTKRRFPGRFDPKYEQTVSGSRPIQNIDFTFIKQSELLHFTSMSKTNFNKSFQLFHDFGY